MKGLIKYALGSDKVALRDIEEPATEPGWVKIRVKAAGICGTDLHVMEDRYDIKPPIVMGHEFSGVVAEVGEGVATWKVGDRVTSVPYVSSCGKCAQCRSGAWNLCPERKALGSKADGAFAPYVVVPESSVRPLPEGVDFHQGSLMEPLACCVHGVLEATRVTAGDVVVIMGPGPIGILSAMLARASGALVILCGVSSDGKRLRIAKGLGIDVVLNVDQDPVSDRVIRLSGGLGADVVVECSGAGPAADLGLSLARLWGSYTQIGLFGQPIELDFERIAYRELRVRGTFSSRWSSWDMAARLLERKAIDLAPMVTDVFPLEEWQSAFATVRAKEGLKVLLIPS
jgi:L-iditol 2-dehydrogenase